MRGAKLKTNEKRKRKRLRIAQLNIIYGRRRESRVREEEGPESETPCTPLPPPTPVSSDLHLPLIVVPLNIRQWKEGIKSEILTTGISSKCMDKTDVRRENFYILTAICQPGLTFFFLFPLGS